MTIAHLNKYWHVWARASVIACHSLTGLVIQKKQGSPVDKNSALNSFNSSDEAAVQLSFMTSKNLSNTRQNLAALAASAGP